MAAVYCNVCLIIDLLCHIWSFTEMNFIIYNMSEIIMGGGKNYDLNSILIVLHIDIVVCSVYFSLL